MSKESLPDQTKSGFTVAYLRKLLNKKYSQRTAYDQNCSGLFVVVNRPGTELVFKCRKNGKVKTLSRFNKDSDSSVIDAARREREKINVEAINEKILSVDPNAIPTYEAVSERFYNEYVITTVKRPDKFRSLLDNHIIPNLGHFYIDQLTTAHFARLIKSIANKGHHGAAESVYMISRRLDKFCISEGIYTVSLSAALDKSMLGAYSNKRERTLDYDHLRGKPDFKNNELKQLFTLLDADKRLSIQVKTGIKFLALTPCRAGELLNSRWKHYDEKTGELYIPKDAEHLERFNVNDRKGGAWIIPLSPQVQALLSDLKKVSTSQWIVGGGAKDVRGNLKPDRRPDDKALRQPLIRLLKKKDKDGNPLLKTTEGAFTIHDLRRTFMSHCKDAGIEKPIAHACQNHAKGRGTVEQTYDHDRLLDLRADALKAWADYVYYHVYGIGENVIRIDDKKLNMP